MRASSTCEDRLRPAGLTGMRQCLSLRRHRTLDGGDSCLHPTHHRRRRLHQDRSPRQPIRLPPPPTPVTPHRMPVRSSRPPPPRWPRCQNEIDAMLAELHARAVSAASEVPAPPAAGYARSDRGDGGGRPPARASAPSTGNPMCVSTTTPTRAGARARTGRRARRSRSRRRAASEATATC